MESVGGIKLPGCTNDRLTQDDDRYIGTKCYNLTSNEFEGYCGGLIGWQNIGNRFIQTGSYASGDIIQTASSESEIMDNVKKMRNLEDVKIDINTFDGSFVLDTFSQPMVLHSEQKAFIVLDLSHITIIIKI